MEPLMPDGASSPFLTTLESTFSVTNSYSMGADFNTAHVRNTSGRPLLSSALHKLFCTHMNHGVVADALSTLTPHFARITDFCFSLLLLFHLLSYFHLQIIPSLMKIA